MSNRSTTVSVRVTDVRLDTDAGGVWGYAMAVDGSLGERGDSEKE
jgi:hypothetical protein